MALDPKLVNLAKAIRQQESGGDPTRRGASGEFGAYQFMPSTWASYAKNAGVNVPLEQADLATQNKVAYHNLERMAREHPEWNVGNFASAWNAGEGRPNAYREGYAGTNSQGVKYDTPAYAKAVNQYYKQFKGMGGTQVAQAATTEPEQVQEPENAYGATFRAEQNDGPVAAGLKTLGNIPSSAFNFAKSTLEALNPISAANRIFNEIPAAYNDLKSQQGGDDRLAIREAMKAAPQEAVNAIVPQGFRQLATGDTQGAQSTFTEDPIGQWLPVVGGARGIAQRTGRGAAFDSAVSNTAQGAMRAAAPVTNAIGKVAKAPGDLAKFGVAQATGLKPQTLNTITENPRSFSRENMGTIDRKAVADEIQAALAKREEEMSETGSAYGPIRSAKIDDPTTPGKQVSASVQVDPAWLERSIRENTGLGVRGGRITPKTTASIREARDIASLQKVYDLWRPAFAKGRLSNEEFLNFRQDMARVAKMDRDVGKSGPLENLSGIMRGRFNTAYRGRIDGLEALDESFAKQAGDIKRLTKGILDKDGNLTTAGINRISNAVGKGKDLELAKLEEIVPGITAKIRIVKAIEDIEDARGQKVGTYARAGLAAFGVGTMNIPAIVGAIISSPDIAVPLLRQYGFAKPLVDAAINGLKKNLNTANNSMKYLDEDVSELKKKLPTPSLGLSVKDITRDGGEPFQHFSKRPDLTHLDPKFSGSNMRGSERADAIAAPDLFQKRNYGYFPNSPAEALVTDNAPFRYTGMAPGKFLELGTNDAKAIAQKATDFVKSQGPKYGPASTGAMNAAFSKFAKEAGYAGIKSKEGIAMFDKVPVKPEGGLVYNNQNYGRYTKGQDSGPLGGKRANVRGTSQGQGPNPEARKLADEFVASKGIKKINHDARYSVDVSRAERIADEYDKLPMDDSGNPAVRKAYNSLAKEIREQWDFLTKKGVKFEPWEKDGQPYANSREMIEDVQKNKHLYFFRGGEPHVFLDKVDQATGYSYNEMFRAIHDYFGHAVNGNSFGPIGEENAWAAHSQMFGDDARKAMTTETRGQNSWVNFGKQNFEADGTYKNIPQKDRPYAVQKIALLPEEFIKFLSGD